MHERPLTRCGCSGSTARLRRVQWCRLLAIVPGTGPGLLVSGVMSDGRSVERYLEVLLATESRDFMVITGLHQQLRCKTGWLVWRYGQMRHAMPVLGNGGLFFRAKNPEALAARYLEHLGVGPVARQRGECKRLVVDDAGRSRRIRAICCRCRLLPRQESIHAQATGQRAFGPD
jgi:hypothetical protein